MCSVDWPAFFGVLKDLALTLAAIATPLVAWRGLQTWRRELRGKADFEVARGLARATYRVREELAACRAPLIRSAENSPDYNPPAPGAPKDPAAEANNLAHIYNNRWKPVTAALRELDAQTLEGEALWGPDIRQSVEALHRCATTVFVAIDSILDNARSGGADFERDKEFGRRTRSQAHASAMATDNPLSKEIAAAVAGIEGKLRTHLARPA
jgi:hypothetical protein